MKEFGTLMSVAFNEPDKLEKLFPPTMEESVQRVEIDPDAWDEDEWWKGTSG